MDTHLASKRKRPVDLEQRAQPPPERIRQADGNLEIGDDKRGSRTVTMREMKKALRDATRTAGDGAEIGGTPHTILKLREPTIGRLLTGGKIGVIELGAIAEIEKVYSHLCANQILRGYEIRERLSPSKRTEPTWFIEAYHKRYKPWADQWSVRWKRASDPTLNIVFDVLFSNRSGKDIDGERNWRHGTALDLFVNGIRDYAAMAGWVDRNTAAKWSEVAREAYSLLRMRTKFA